MNTGSSRSRLIAAITALSVGVGSAYYQKDTNNDLRDHKKEADAKYEKYLQDQSMLLTRLRILEIQQERANATNEETNKLVKQLVEKRR